MRGAALLDWPFILLLNLFLLTRLMRGAAIRSFLLCLLIGSISTHAPHARRGAEIRDSVRNLHNFYSRASCEARR